MEFLGPAVSCLRPKRARLKKMIVFVDHWDRRDRKDEIMGKRQRQRAYIVWRNGEKLENQEVRESKYRRRYKARGRRRVTKARVIHQSQRVSYYCSRETCKALFPYSKEENDRIAHGPYATHMKSYHCSLCKKTSPSFKTADALAKHKAATTPTTGGVQCCYNSSSCKD
ncbi:hypothetical protein ACLB2K_057194 [Fragaria x ananassa]